MEQDPLERWLPVVGFEGRYEVSNLGRVRSLDRIIMRGRTKVRRKGVVLAQQEDGDGYPKVSLGRAAQRKVHRLVAEAFLPNPSDLSEVDHRNRDKRDARVENLEWVDKAENTRRMHAACRTRWGSVPEETRRQAVKLVANGEAIMSVASILGISRVHVRRIVGD